MQTLRKSKINNEYHGKPDSSIFEKLLIAWCDNLKEL